MTAAVLPSSTSITSALSDLSSHKVKNPWDHDSYCETGRGCKLKPEASICQAAIALDHIWGRGRALKTCSDASSFFVCLDEGLLTEKAGTREVCVCVSTPNLLFLSVFLTSAWKHIIPRCHRSVKVPLCELLCARLTKRTLPTRKGRLICNCSN